MTTIESNIMKIYNIIVAMVLVLSLVGTSNATGYNDIGENLFSSDKIDHMGSRRVASNSLKNKEDVVVGKAVFIQSANDYYSDWAGTNNSISAPYSMVLLGIGLIGLSRISRKNFKINEPTA